MTAEVGTQIVGTPVTLTAPARSAAAVQVARLTDPDHLAARWTAPTIVDGEIVAHPPYRSPLDADEHGQYPTVLRGGVVYDRAVVRQIATRVERPGWRRLLTGRWS